MKTNIEFKQFEPRNGTRELIDQLIKKVEKRIKKFPENAVFLRVLVEHNATRKRYPVSITLEVPGKTLATKEERHDLDETLRDAFAEIERQLDRYRGKLYGEQWKRPARREKIRELKIKAARSEGKQA